MSEEDTKPGAPAAEEVAEKAEHIEDAGSAVEKKLEAIQEKFEVPIKKAPGSALKLLSDVDKTTLRINKYGTTRRSVRVCEADNEVVGFSQRRVVLRPSCQPSTILSTSSLTRKPNRPPLPRFCTDSFPLSGRRAPLQSPAQQPLSMQAPSHLLLHLQSWSQRRAQPCAYSAASPCTHGCAHFSPVLSPGQT